jgi:hypothetical protein
MASFIQLEEPSLPIAQSSSATPDIPFTALGSRREPLPANQAITSPFHVSAAGDPLQPTDADIPDGGYGFVVVAACAVITFWFVGTSYSWGVIQSALVDQGLSQPSTLAFVGAFTAACIAFLAIINAKVVTTIGARRTGLLGIGLLGLGGILGGFSTHSIGALFATIGVIMGVGTRYMSWNDSKTALH